MNKNFELQEPMPTMTIKNIDKTFEEMIIDLIDVKLIFYRLLNTAKKGCAE